VSILSSIVSWVTGGLVDKIVGLGEAYFNKQISEAQFRSEVEKSAQETAAKIEASWAQAASEIAKSTSETLKASPVMQKAFSIVLFLQLFVLVWYQIGAPAYLVITGTAWPSPGASVEWAYLLIGGMVGLGPFVFRRGESKP